MFEDAESFVRSILDFVHFIKHEVHCLAWRAPLRHQEQDLGKGVDPRVRKSASIYP